MADLPSPIVVTAPARAALLEHLARDGTARFIRVHVGRG
jgi:hypothetical protein